MMLLFVILFCNCFFFKQKTAYEMRISDWSSDVCFSDLALRVDCRSADFPGLAVHSAAGATAVVVVAVAGAPRPEPEQAAEVRTRSDGRRPRVPGPGVGRAPSAEIGRASCRDRVCRYV